jgi:hypothetical protein
MKYTILLLVLILSKTSQAADSTKNYCHNQSLAAEWEALVKQSPKDFGLQRLHALRLGICLKIENKTLDLDDGNAIFEQEREALIRERLREERKQEEKKKEQRKKEERKKRRNSVH